MSEDLNCGRGGLGQKTAHLVQTERGHLLPIHLQDLVPNCQQTCVELLSAAVHHVLHIHTYRGQGKVEHW